MNRFRSLDFVVLQSIFTIHSTAENKKIAFCVLVWKWELQSSLVCRELSGILCLICCMFNAVDDVC